MLQFFSSETLLPEVYRISKLIQRHEKPTDYFILQVCDSQSGYFEIFLGSGIHWIKSVRILDNSD